MNSGGVLDVLVVEVVFEQAIHLARGMQKEIKDFFNDVLNPNTACHKRH